MTRYLRYLIALTLVAAWAAVPYLLPGRLSIFVTILIYAPIVIGLSMLAGYAGQASLGQAAFFGTGAYVNGVLISQYGTNPWIASIVAIAATGLLAYIVGGPVLLLRGHYLVIATLGFNIIVEVFARQLRDLTGGNSGLPGITSLEFGAYEGDVFYYYAAGLLTIVAMLLSRNLVQSRFGRAAGDRDERDRCSNTVHSKRPLQEPRVRLECAPGGSSGCPLLGLGLLYQPLHLSLIHI